MNRLLFVLLVLAVSMPVQAFNRAGCLLLDSINWRLPATPVGPSWTMKVDSVVRDTLEPQQLTLTFWRRPCNAYNSQLLLTISSAKPDVIIGAMTMYQGGVDYSFTHTIVTKGILFDHNVFPLLYTPARPFTGLVMPWSSKPGDIFAINHNKRVLMAWKTPETGPDVERITYTVDIPAYSAEDYAAGGPSPEPDPVPGQVNIVPAMSGSWYDPAQDGHGLAIEILPGNGILASWYGFSPTGAPMWITAQGDISGHRAYLKGYQKTGSGGRFPPHFDASRVQDVYWGVLELEFSACGVGELHWDSVISGYGSGTMPIRQLTAPAGTNCP